MNIQSQEKRVNSDLLQVHSIFRTIQGEGPFQGEPAIFIRLAGCNLQCPNCDTDYTSSREAWTPEQIIFEVRATRQSRNIKLVVITGGEPFRQNLTRLCNLLQISGFYVQIETNGTIPPSLKLSYNPYATKSGVTVVVSPKTPNINEDILQIACAVKYILSANHVDDKDGLPTSVLGYNHLPARIKNKQVYVIPEDSYDYEQNASNRLAVIESAMKFGYNVQLQLHKYLHME